MAFILGNGLLSGMILAAFLALCDGLFKTKTFEILIDVSYVPGFENLPSVIELLIHLLISIVITFLFTFLYPMKSWMTPRYLASWIGIFFVLYFPFSILSGQGISFWACIIWIVGHILYTMFLAFQVEKHS